MLAFLSINPDRVAQLFTGLLAVAGGYVLGYVLIGVAAHFFDRRLTGGKSPGGMHKAARHVGGVVGALLVAFVVFGRGGSGGGTGDGTGPGKDGGTGTGTSPSTPPSARAPDAPVTPPPPPPLSPVEEVIQVLVLSGAEVQAERFYLIDKDRTPRTLAEVKDFVQTKRPPGGKPVAIAVRFTPRTDRENSGVRDLESWAQSAGMRVILPGKE